MTLRRPSLSDINSISERYNLSLTEAEANDIAPIVAGVIGGYDVLDQLPEPLREVTPAIRSCGARPEPENDPLNGIVRECSVLAVPEVTNGALSGKRIGLKDTISVAGIPMTCASRLLYGYTPIIDATVTKRIIEAGGHITAMLNTDDFAFSGGGHTSVYGPGRNPVDQNHVPGGSSCGSATAVASEQVDISLGGDQGGSIRIPSSFSGIAGMKPTHSLVPYTGIVGFDQTIDHVGPMANKVEDLALMLNVIAGVDTTATDPRQPSNIEVPDYTAALTGDMKGLKVAVIKEGFETAEAMETVNKAVRGAIEKLKALGAVAEEVSVPSHVHVVPVWNAIAIEGGISNFYHGLTAYQHKGYYDPHLISHMMRAIKANGGDLSPTAKMGAVVGHYMREYYHGVYYARAQNFSRKLTNDYNEVLESADLVVMPTTPQTAHKMPPMPEEDRPEYISQALNMVANTAAFDLTGHPSVSVPVHGVDGLPVGLMMTGRHFDDATVLRAAHAYQRAG